MNDRKIIQKIITRIHSMWFAINVTAIFPITMTTKNILIHFIRTGVALSQHYNKSYISFPIFLVRVRIAVTLRKLTYTTCPQSREAADRTVYLWRHLWHHKYPAYLIDNRWRSILNIHCVLAVNVVLSQSVSAKIRSVGQFNVILC